MRTSYWLVTAAGLAAAAGVAYLKYPGRSGARELPLPPTEPLPPRFGPADVHLPPVVPPPDAPLVIPVAVPPPAPVLPPTTVPASPPAAVLPAIPLPEAPAAPPAPPVLPQVPPAATVPPPPPATAPTPVPVIPPAPKLPVLDPVPPVAVPPAPPPAAVLPKPAPLPEPVTPPQALLPQPRPDVPPAPVPAVPDGKKYVVLKGDRLVEGTEVTAAGEKVLVRQGSLDRAFPKADVAFVGESRDDVRRYMVSRVPEGDAAARLKVARWLMFAGLREQAVVEAREVARLQPGSTAVRELIRSLEESLKQFPADGSAPALAARPAAGGALEADGPEAELTAEGATAFAARAQPVLVNQCMDCHARPDYAGPFKLVRVTGFEVGPQSTKANLRATATQLRRDDPANSPLLAKALSAHGGMKQPAFPSRQSGGYKVLEAWVASAVVPLPPPMGTPVPPPMATPTEPQVATVPVAPPAPATPVLPPVEPTPALAPTVPPAPPVPAVPEVPPIPPAAETFPAVPVVPPVELPTVPTPPAIPLLPPVEAPTAPVPPPVDVLPAVPPVLPTPPSLPPVERPAKVPAPAVTPAPKPAAPLPPPGEFGAGAPVMPAPTGPTAPDEFDPETFNRAAPRK